MLTVQLLEQELSANVGVDTLVTLSLNVDLSPAQQVLVELTPTVPLLEGFSLLLYLNLFSLSMFLGQQYANANLATQVTHTQTVFLILVPVAPAARELFVKTMDVQPSASVLHNILETPMLRVDEIPAVGMLVVLTQTVLEVETEPFVNVEVDILEAPTAGQDAEPTHVWRVFVEQELNAKIKEDDLFANVYQAIKETPTLAVFKGSVTKTLIVDLSELVKTTSVLILVAFLVDKEQTVPYRIM